MALTPGTRLGPYEVTAPIGSGGMGEVYSATDTRLDRTVAIKVLPEHLADDPQRRERFEREAKAVSSLNHPHICTLYDVGEQDGTHYLVMELVEGQTLEQRLEKGRLPLDQALEYAIQIADALDKAHRQGVVHRDLKPGNIMLTKSGVKLLDFGLAKLAGDAGPAPTFSRMPTADYYKPLTAAGTILGTVRYMAPEQLEGKGADARTDIFAFGAILYEMVTGKKAFGGKSQASLISSIMSSQPEPLSNVQPLAPPALEHFVRMCLEKDGESRWQTAHDLKVQLKWIAEGETQLLTDPQGMLVQKIVETQLRRKLHLIVRRVALSVLVSMVVAGGMGWYLRNPPPSVSGRFVISAPPSLPVRISGTTTELAVSPDGNQVVYSVELEGRTRLYLRAVDQLEGTVLPVAAASNPFFSPDGAWIGINDLGDGSLQRISRVGGQPETISRLDGTALGADWGADNNIIFATSNGGTGLFRVSFLGGEPELLTTPDSGEDHLWPAILPGEKAVLFTIRSGYGVENSRIAALNMETREQSELISGGSHARYAATGHIVYAVEDTLRAVAFDPDSLEILGAPVPVLEGLVSTVSGAAPYGLSRDGSLVFAGGEPLTNDRILAFVDRSGNLEPLEAEPKPYLNPRLSPNGTGIAVQTLEESGQSDIWLYTPSAGTAIRQLTQEGNNVRPLWTPDGQRVTFASDREGVWGIYSQRVDGRGVPELLTSAMRGTELWPESWSPDGRTLSFTTVTGERRAIATLSIDGGETTEEIFYEAEGFQVAGSTFSPDGRWLAYYSNEDTSFDIYLQEFPRSGTRNLITRGGGVFPLWSSDGSELFYRRPNTASSVQGARLIAMDITTGDTFGIGNEQTLPIQGFTVITTHRDYDITGDGEQFLMVFPTDVAEPGLQPSQQVNIVLNWHQELLERVPVD